MIGSKLVCLFIFSTLIGPGWTSWRDRLKCSACSAAVYLISGAVRLTGSGAIIKNNSPLVCNWLNIDSEICQSYVDSWLEPLTYIIRNTDLGMSHMCGLYLPACQTQFVREALQREIGFDVAHKRAALPSLPFPPPGVSSSLRVLQLADFHYDREYKAGSSNTCNYPLCCREVNGFPNDISMQAGFWGDYSCDTPPTLLNSLFKHLRKQHSGNVDYIMWTGDAVPHDSWKTSRDDVIEVTEILTSLLRSTFPGIPVVPVIGNHDSSPINFFPPPDVERYEFKGGWLYERLAGMWRHWLPPTAIETFRFGGYYELEIKHGLRLLVLNTNVAYSLNLWVIMTATSDTYNQLQWLRERLTLARKFGYRCHILGHISPADSQVIPSWSHVYHNLIYSFSDVVAAQFFSHTHLDEFQLFRDESGSPFSVAYVSPSISPWKNVNPGYKIYYISNSSAYGRWEVADVERWGMDLDKANLGGDIQPNWHHLYTSSRRFQLPDLSPISWDGFLTAMTSDHSLFSSYYSELSGQSRNYGNQCDSTCRWRVLCAAVTTDGSSTHQCDELKSTHSRQNRMFGWML